MSPQHPAAAVQLFLRRIVKRAWCVYPISRCPGESDHDIVAPGTAAQHPRREFELAESSSGDLSDIDALIKEQDRFEPYEKIVDAAVAIRGSQFGPMQLSAPQTIRQVTVANCRFWRIAGYHPRRSASGNGSVSSQASKSGTIGQCARCHEWRGQHHDCDRSRGIGTYVRRDDYPSKGSKRIVSCSGCASYRDVTDSTSSRNYWIARHILPNEPALRRYLARQRMPSGFDVEDVIQEVYGRIVALPVTDHIRDPRTFMIGVARNILLTHYRRSRIVPILSAQDINTGHLVADEPSPEQSVNDRQQLHLLALAVARTREPWRTAFLLRVTEELSHGEIGQRLGLSENAVQKGLSKTLTKLMALLGRGGNDRSHATQEEADRKDNDGSARVEHRD